jgi:hypothetical protein
MVVLPPDGFEFGRVEALERQSNLLIKWDVSMDRLSKRSS